MGLRFSATLTAAGLCLLALRAVAQDVPKLPALTDPPGDSMPGKFVWADLVTDKFDAAREFYQTFLPLGWELVATTTGQRYGILTHNGVRVAGIAEISAAGGASQPGQWVHYLSVPDVAAAEREMTRMGGKTVLAQRVVEARGTFAVVEGPGGEVLGLMRSSSGDPGDFRAEGGDWIWRELLTPDVDKSADAFRQVCQCEVFPPVEGGERFFAASQGYLRAAISPLGDSSRNAVWLGFIRVADIADAVRRATGLGAELLLAPTSDLVEGDLAVIRDPAGGVLGLLAWDFDRPGGAQ